MCAVFLISESRVTKQRCRLLKLYSLILLLWCLLMLFKVCALKQGWDLNEEVKQTVVSGALTVKFHANTI